MDEWIVGSYRRVRQKGKILNMFRYGIERAMKVFMAEALRTRGERHLNVDKGSITEQQ